MDDKYILEHLKKWAKLLYSNKKKHFAFKKRKYYHFGYETKNRIVANSVTKAVAICIIIGKLPENESKKEENKKGKKKIKRKKTVKKKTNKSKKDL